MVISVEEVQESWLGSNKWQEQNHRKGGHMEGYQWGGSVRRIGEKVQGIRSIVGR